MRRLTPLRTGRTVTALLVIALVGAAGFWAGRVVLVPPEDPLEGGSEPITYTVVEGRVGRSLQFATVAEWVLVPLAWNAAFGVVTSVDVSSGDEVGVGDVLYTVNLRPVVVAAGVVPAFRDLSQNATGADVAQLQRFLAELGFYLGEVDGVFRTSTRLAVRAWQESLGVPIDGVVRRGDVIFIPGLPVRVAFSSELVVGASLVGGERLVLEVPADPVFRVPLSVEQRSLVPLSAPVRVTYTVGVWEGRVDRAIETPEMGRLDLILTAPDGGPICGAECAQWVALDSPTDFLVEIVVIPETVGPVVPVAAIGFDAGNQPYVTTAAGERIDVTIVESSQGIAVVDGVEVGTVILVRVTPPPGG
jgi:peptidoglycan hydrolase-like protein with peptidoglycan-binding domain